MKLEDFLKMLDSPYAREVYEDARDNALVTDADVQDVLDFLDDDQTPQEMYECLDISEDEYDNAGLDIGAGEVIRDLLAAADFDVQLDEGIWEFRSYGAIRNALRTGVYERPLERASRIPKAADYAAALKLYPSESAHKHACIAWNYRDMRENPLGDSEMFYFLPRTTWVLASVDANGLLTTPIGVVEDLMGIYKCKEHPDLLFLAWDNGVSMVYQDVFLDEVTHKGQKPIIKNGFKFTRDTLEDVIRKDAQQDDFEEYSL